MAKLTLAELEALDNNPNVPAKTPPAPPPPDPVKLVDPPTPPAPPIKTGTGEPAPANIEEARQKQVAEAETARLATEAANIAAGKNADGTEKTQAQKDADAAVLKTEEEEEEQDLAVWAEVDKLWGEPITVVYKNEAGEDIHPNDPQGIFLREKAILAKGAEEFETYIQKTDPRSYAYMLHRQAGGTDEEFFAKKTVTLPVYEEFQSSVDLRTRVYADSLRVKGLDESSIKLLVDAAVKDKKLEALSDLAYKSTEKAQQDEIKKLNDSNAKQQQQYQQQVAALSKTLTEEMNSGMKIIIPEAKKQEFSKFVRDHLQEDGGQFFFAQPIDQRSLPKLLDAMYFLFAGGNLQDLVTRQAQTATVVRLRRNVDKSKQTPTGGAGSGSDKPRKMTLGEL